MATRDITIEYPDGAASRILTALKAHYGQIQDAQSGQMRDRTNAEAFEAFEASVRNSLVHIVRKYEKDTAAKTAADAVQDVEVT